MKKVIVFGSLNMDLTIEVDEMPKMGETISGDHFFTNAGGKGANQAVAAAKLGAQTYLIGQVGADGFGESLLKEAKEYGVKVDSIKKHPELATGVAMIIRNSGDNRIILSHGANYGIDPTWAEETLQNLGAKGDIFISQFECNKEATLKALQTAKQQEMFTVFNPAPVEEMDQEMLELIDLLVVNQTECEVISGIYPEDEQSCQLAMKVIKEKGTKHCIITLGSKGSVIELDGKMIYIQGHKVNAIDTTAAGDTYIGALAACLTQDKTMTEAMEFATKAAALTVTRVGAQQSIPYLNELV